MSKHRILNIAISFIMIFGMVFSGVSKTSAMPMNPTDPMQVPHYFGPNPNWANSPFTLPDAQVVITGNGTGATAEAIVGANGSIVDVIVTDPGSGYSNAKIDFLGSGTGATADATIVKKGAVVAITVDTPGSGYTAPVVDISVSGQATQATATAFGGVEQVLLSNGGIGYSQPTVEFGLPDAADGVQAKGYAEMDANGTITAVIVTLAGSGYATAPKVAIHNGTLADPIQGATLASATTTLFIDQIVLDTFGANYNNPPTVTINDLTGSGATATATLDNGTIVDIVVKNPGSGYLTQGGIRKFVDTLPGLNAAGANNLGQYIPVAVADTTVFNQANGFTVDTDYYVIAVIQHREKMHSDLPPTLLREYVQLASPGVAGAVPLFNDMVDGSSVPALMPDGSQAFGVDNPHYLGPLIIAQKDRAVRITFFNLLPTGAEGDLFLPVDTTIMGSGMGPDEMGMMEPMDEGTVMDGIRNPMCTDKSDPMMDPMTREMCFTENRATLHLHGGNTPWISDGTPHQWITPAGEMNPWPQGVSVVNVPDMISAELEALGVPNCDLPGDGCQTFYYTNQQSARLMFYHDHSWGITRLNVYAGEAAAYLIQDPTEQALVDSGVLPSDQIPLVIQERTFVPQVSQMYNVYDEVTGEVISYGQDPTWDETRWGGYGNLWYHHVYMPAQNPGDPSGMSAFGRWMFSPWFWPPQDAKYPPIANPYYDPACNLDDPATWTYQEDPYCEPAMIPGTPLIAAGMEQFNDTPVVNGTAYPTVTLEPKAYRLRILNAANDRFWNLQWYIADATTASIDLNANGEVIGGTEVALNAAEVAAAQLDPVQFPTPDLALSPAGPDWIVIGSESGFLPAPVVVDGQQVTTWIEDPTRFDAGLVDQHSLLLAPAERSDVVVDFSKFAGQTLILYNDAPAAFPARIPSYDYYTGAPDLRPVGAPQILPGYGPNTRTIMQVKIAASAPAPAFNLTALNAAFRHQPDGSGVFEAGQHPIIVGQAAYNSAYGSSFAASGWCNSPTNPSVRCDGFARILEQGGDMFKFDTLLGDQLSVKIEPKAIQDETSESNFDEFGRMSAVLGVEVVPATPGVANTVLFPYMSSITELIDTTDLPRADIKVTPISKADDGTQIWKITHNGVDTHPIHVHGFDAQLLNRVTWDNIIKPPHPTELGWKETFRVSPLEDTYFVLRPVIPTLPFDIPNSVRLLSPMMADGEWIANTTLAEQLGLPILGFAPNGDPIDITNHFVNFGAEYVYHCHILSHEEMDMMRPMIFAYPPVAPSGLAFDALTGTLTWTDKSLSETAFVVEQSSDLGATWTAVGRIDRLLTDVNTTGSTESFVIPAWLAGDQFRVVAENTVGDTWDYSDPNLNEILPGTFAFPVITTTAVSEVIDTTPPPAAPTAPSGLLATLEAGSQVSLAWTDNSLDETGFVIQRSTDGVTFSDLATVGLDTVTYVDTTVLAGNTYTYQVAAVNLGGSSAFAVSNSVLIPGPTPPAAPEGLEATLEDVPLIHLAWTDLSADETSFLIQRSTDGINFSELAIVPADSITYDDLAVFGAFTYTYQVAAVNANGTSAFAVSNAVPVPADVTAPAAPSNLTAINITTTSLTLGWLDNSNNESGFTIQIATNSSFTKNLVTIDAPTNATSFEVTGLKSNIKYYIRIQAYNLNFTSAWSPVMNVSTLNK